MEKIETKGIGKYYTFGLRTDWMNEFFKKGISFFENNTLGPCQVLAFKNYLRDSEILIENRLNDYFFNILKNILNINHITFWGIIWINISYNSNLFKWWTTLQKGIYKKNEIEKMLANNHGKFNRTIIDAYNSLIGTFKTPIGNDLKQCNIRKEMKEIILIKEGEPDLQPIVLLYNMYKFAERTNLYEFSMYEIENKLLSPQKVFCMNSNRIEKLIIPYSYQEVIDLNIENNILKIKLRKNLSSIELLNKFIGGKIR